MILLSYGAWITYKDFTVFSKTTDFEDLSLIEKLRFRYVLYTSIFSVIFLDAFIIYVIQSNLVFL